MKTILIDDEPFALEVLKHLLSSYKEIDVVGSFTSYTDALEFIKDVKPDNIFLDIEMGEMNGLELAEIFMNELEGVEIVFVTAYSQYAVNAFEINAIDYLLKPVQKNRLSKAIARLKDSKKERGLASKKVLNNLKIYSFGGFQVIDDKRNSLNWRTVKSKELFSYLWTRKDRVSSKDLIIDSIFPDRDLDKASTILHTTIYQLRKNLEKLGYPNVIIYSDEGYQLDLPASSDLEDLKEIMQRKTHDENDILEILKIYRGQFLEESYPWALELQQKYENLVYKVIETFVKKQIEEDNYIPVLKAALDKLYSIDSLNNSLVELIIHYHGKQDKIPSLKSFFINYKEQLWEEMELKPTKRLINVYNQYM